MPDSLILEIPAHPAASTAAPALSPVPFDATDVLVRLYREAQAAEAALNASEEPDDGPHHERYGAARDRFIDARVNTVGDILLKLERYADVEDLEAEPHLIGNRILLNLLRDLRATDAAYGQLSAIEAARRPCPAALPPNTPDDSSDASTLDLKAIHAAADNAVDRLYGRQCLLGDGLAVLHETFMEGVSEHPRGAEANFMFQALKMVADNIISDVDDIVNAIDPLNPTILDE
jgi:hypothetical protein